METLSKVQLLSLFSPVAQAQLTAVLDKPGVRGIAVYENDEGKRKAVPLTPRQPNALEGGWRLFGTHQKVSLSSSQSRTMAALEWLAANPDTSVFAAAKMYGITPTAIYRAQRRRKGKLICPCCRQVVPAGFTLP